MSVIPQVFLGRSVFVLSFFVSEMFDHMSIFLRFCANLYSRRAVFPVTLYAGILSAQGDCIFFLLFFVF